MLGVQMFLFSSAPAAFAHHPDEVSNPTSSVTTDATCADDDDAAGGYEDVLRSLHDGPGPFTWWDYRDGAFHRGLGLRIDLVLATAVIAKGVIYAMADRDERKQTSGETGGFK